MSIGANFVEIPSVTLPDVSTTGCADNSTWTNNYTLSRFPNQTAPIPGNSTSFSQHMNTTLPIIFHKESSIGKQSRYGSSVVDISPGGVIIDIICNTAVGFGRFE